jgi:hypothetical protein
MVLNIRIEKKQMTVTYPEVCLVVCFNNQRNIDLFTFLNGFIDLASVTCGQKRCSNSVELMFICIVRQIASTINIVTEHRNGVQFSTDLFLKRRC